MEYRIRKIRDTKETNMIKGKVVEDCTDYVELKRVETVEELKALGFDYILKDYDPKDILGNWFETGNTRCGVPEGARKTNISVGHTINVRFYTDNVEAYVSGTNAYIEEEKYEELVT